MGRGNPELDSKAERVRFAIRKKHFEDDEWSNQEIADELNVRPEVVSRYLNESPQAKELEKAKEAIEQERWKELLYDLLRRLDKLMELEEQAWRVVEPKITQYSAVPTEARIEEYHMQSGGDSIRLDLGSEDEEDDLDPVSTEVEIPVPAEWEQMPSFNRLKRIWDERRKTQDQLVDLLGLEAADELSLTGDLTERKVFAIDDDYPDVEPHAKGEEPPQEPEQEESGGEPQEAQDDDS